MLYGGHARPVDCIQFGVGWTVTSKHRGAGTVQEFGAEVFVAAEWHQAMVNL